MRRPQFFQPRVSSFQHHGVFGLAIVLTLTGCSADYNGERLFWKAQQLEKPILKEPAKVTPAQIDAAQRAFEQVVARAPGTAWAARSYAIIGSLHAIRKEFDQARASYRLILQNYNQYRDLCLNARLATAKTYEIEQKWDEAVTAFQDIADQHPWSRSGLEVPLYIAVLHEKHGRKAQVSEDYERAVRIYTKMVPDAPNPDMAAQVKGYLAVAYQRLGEWDHAIELLKELATLSGVNRPLVLLTLGSIYQTKMGNTQKAEEAYRQLIQEFPEHPFVKAAKVQLGRLGASVDGADATDPTLDAATNAAPLPGAATNLPETLTPSPSNP